MQFLLLSLLLISQTYSTSSPISRVQLAREGTLVVGAVCTLMGDGKLEPLTIEIEREGRGMVDSLIVLPNQRLADMEAYVSTHQDATFRVSGEIFAHANRNYILIRETVAEVDHANRNHPAVVPSNPNEENNTNDNADDSIESIVKDLEETTGPLLQSIRNAAANPLVNNEQSETPQSSRYEGARISARRCYLSRNDLGAWVAIFVADASGLSDQPCTVLPSAAFAGLTRWAAGNNIATPVLLTGEIMVYHGHAFLVLHSWRTTHKSDHLDG